MSRQRGMIYKKPNSLIYTGFFKSLPQTMQGYFEQLQYQEKKIALNMLNKMINETDMDTAITAFL